jgi:hypothetical protein
MDMYEILVLTQVFMFGWVSCHFYMAWKMRKALKKVAEDNGMSLDELADTFLQTQGVRTITVPNYFTETNGSSILLYNKDTGDFIGQANTVDELAENVYKFDRVKFALVNHDNKEFWFVEGKIKDNLKDIE